MRSKNKKCVMSTGRHLWSRRLVSTKITPLGREVRVYFSPEGGPNFRCIFLAEAGDKHLLVRGPDGEEYTVHKCYAGKNPSCSQSFDGFYKPVQLARGVRFKDVRHKKGSSLPGDSTERKDMRQMYWH